MKNVDKRTIAIWNLQTVVKMVLFIAVTAMVFYFFHEYQFVRKIYFCSNILVILYFVWDILLNPFYYNNSKYQLEEYVLYIKMGALTIQETTIPLRKIQHVDIGQSFFSRIFNLYSITIYTAGDTHSISYVMKKEADLLKTEIINYLIHDGVVIDEEER